MLDRVVLYQNLDREPEDGEQEETTTHWARSKVSLSSQTTSRSVNGEVALEVVHALAERGCNHLIGEMEGLRQSLVLFNISEGLKEVCLAREELVSVLAIRLT